MSDVNQVAATLNSAAIHLLRGLAPVDRLSGLSSARLSALSVVHFGGPQSLASLAAAEDVTPATMTRLVDGLEADGLVEREVDPADRRRVRITATRRGAELMEVARQRRVEAIAAALGTLAPGERQSLAEAAPLLAALAPLLRPLPTPVGDAVTPTSRRRR